MTVSRIFAGGVKATAIASIVSDVGAMFTADARGVKVLDRTALRDYLLSEFARLATADDGAIAAPADAASVSAAAEALGYTEMIEALDAAIGEQAMTKRQDWPAAASGPGFVVEALTAARAKTATAAADLGALYLWTQNDTLLSWVRSFYHEKNLDYAVPPAVTPVYDTRTYRAVYRTDKGELSKASDATALLTVDQNDTVNLTAAAPPGGRFIDTVLWYRSNSSNQGVAFQFVGERAVVDGLTFGDNKLAAELAESLQTVEWDVPPTDLRGLRMHPGNFGVAFFGNTICPSVQNRLYAWPVLWRKTTLKPIVGIEIADQTIFVGTQGEPYIVTGADPAFLGAEKVRGGQPCRSGRSIVATSRGFMYAGADGVALCSGQVETPVLTRQHFTKEQWEALKPESIQAVEHDGCYYFLWNNGVTSGCYSLGIESGRLATVALAASALFKNTSNGRLYAVSGTQIVEVFGGGGRRTGFWRSPRQSATGGFAWLKAVGDYEAGNVTVRWNRWFEDRAGGVTADVKTYAATNRQPQRVHAGKPTEYEIEVEGASAVTLLVLAGSSAELQQ